MRSIRTIIIIVAASLALVACGNVTETGNPIYVNDTFGVQIEYPTGWEETATEASTAEPLAGDAGPAACFQYGTEGSSACISMTFLDPEPVSLIAYLSDRWPERSFTPYSTSTLDGYAYDDPAVGPYGGDLQEYYFLNGNVFVSVVVEALPGDEMQIAALLDGISFQ